MPDFQEFYMNAAKGIGCALGWIVILVLIIRVLKK